MFRTTTRPYLCEPRRMSICVRKVTTDFTDDTDTNEKALSHEPTCRDLRLTEQQQPQIYCHPSRGDCKRKQPSAVFARNPGWTDRASTVRAICIVHARIVAGVVSRRKDKRLSDSKSSRTLASGHCGLPTLCLCA